MLLYLPCIGDLVFWSKLVQNSPATIYTNHTFQKQCDLSQFEIASAQGRQKLSIPTVKATRKGLYKNVEIDFSSNWQLEHWRSIENAYLKSPFFLYYGYKIEPLLTLKEKNLLTFNKALIGSISNCLKMTSPAFNNKEQIAVNRTKEVLGHPPLEYPQVFDTRVAFQENLSILDLLFHLGQETKEYLSSLHL